MRCPAAFLSAVALAAFAADTGVARERAKHVVDWVSNDVAVRLSDELSKSPRYRDALVSFVVFVDGRPAARSNRLALGLRDRLQERVVADGRVRTAWAGGTPAGSGPLPATGSDCEAGRADLLAGIELDRSRADEVTARLRVLDVAEREWVPGLRLEWRGRLNRGQQRDLEAAADDQTQRGQRSLPFDPDEPDLIARQLAHSLRCELMRGVHGEYVVAGQSAGDGGDAIVALVRNQLGGLSTLSLTAAAERANAELTGSLHEVDRGLGQYWLTLLPTDPDSELEPLSASVYVAATQGSGAIPDGRILTRVDPIHLLPGRECAGVTSARIAERPVPATDSCAAFRIRTNRDAVVFVLNHPLNRGLSRIGSTSCGRLRPAGVARRGEELVVRLPTDNLRGNWQASDRWSPAPSADTWYALAVANSKAARAIAAEVAKLPERCTAAIQPGLTGGELERWLTNFESLLGRWSPAVDWQALQVRQIY